MYDFNRNTQFHISGTPAGFGSIDFWEWFASYTLDGSIRGGMAEFVIMKALGIENERNIWDAYDLEYQGKRIEVKSASLFTRKNRHGFQYEYTINQRITYSIEPKHKHVIGGDWTSRKRNSDIYIFVLISDMDISNLDKWDFYIIPTESINKTFGDQKTLSLSAIKRFTPPPKKFVEIRKYIDLIIKGGIDMSYDPNTEKDVPDREAEKIELQRLIACYQVASPDDKNVVWAALNKYASQIDRI